MAVLSGSEMAWLAENIEETEILEMYSALYKDATGKEFKKKEFKKKPVNIQDAIEQAVRELNG